MDASEQGSHPPGQITKGILIAICMVLHGYAGHIGGRGALPKAASLLTIRQKLLPYTAPGRWETDGGEQIFLTTPELDEIREAINGFIKLAPHVAGQEKERAALLADLKAVERYLFSLPEVEVFLPKSADA